MKHVREMRGSAKFSILSVKDESPPSGPPPLRLLLSSIVRPQALIGRLQEEGRKEFFSSWKESFPEQREHDQPAS